MNHDHVVDPEVFLDRRADRTHLARLLREGRNVLLYGPRRVGKTSLLKRLAVDLEDDCTFIRIDCQFATDAVDLSKLILKGLAASGIAKGRRFLEWVRSAADGLRISVTIHQDAVVPTVETGTKPVKSLQDTMEFLGRISDHSKNPIVLSLDEFQEVLAWDQKGEGQVVPTLRAFTQEHPRLQLVITGSAAHTVLELTRAENPFWKQLTEYRLAGMDVDDLADDYARLHGLHLPDASRRLIAKELVPHTMQMIQVLDILRRRMDDASPESVAAAMEAAITDNLSEYERILDRADTALRRRLLLALAAEQPDHPTGNDFLGRNRLGTGAGVTKSLKLFRQAGILDDDNRFLDPLFRRYLAENVP